MAAALGYAKAIPQAGALLPDVGRYAGASVGYGGPLQWPGWNSLSNDATDAQRARTALANSWVYSTIGTIARELGVPNIAISREQSGEKMTAEVDHPFEKLWKRPNRFMGANFIAQMWVWQRFLFGEAYIFCAPAGNQIAELWPIPSQWMRPDPDEKDFIKGYIFQKSSADRPISIPAEYVCYSRIPHPFDPHRGLSPIAAAMLAIQTDQAQQQWNKGFFARDNAKIANVISLPSEMSDQDFLRVKEEIRDFYGGTTQRSMITRGGQLDVKLLGVSQKDMDFLKGREMTRDEIGQIFGFPGGYFNANATEANARHAKAVVIENIIWPTLESWAEDWTAQVLPFWFDAGLVAHFEDIRPRDRVLEIQEAEGRLKYWTLNEIRQEEGKDPLPDPPEYVGLGDEMPALAAVDVYAMVATQRLAAKAAPGPDGTAPAGGTRLLLRPTAGNGAIPGQDAIPSGPGNDSQDSTTKALRQWEAKATKALRAGRSAAVRFETDALNGRESARISLALLNADTPAAVKAAFKAKPTPAIADPDEAERIFEERCAELGWPLEAKGKPEPFQELNRRVAGEYMRKYGAQLAAGKITSAQFETKMAAEIRDAAVAAYRFEIKRPLTVDELDRVNGIVAKQVEYLGDFLSEIKSAGQDLGFVEARAGLYAGVAAEAKTAGLLVITDDNEELTWDGPDGESSCEDCAALIGVTRTAKAWDESGDAPGAMACGDNCRCEIA